MILLMMILTPWDDNGHGTLVTQILRRPNTRLPLQGAEVYEVKVLDETGTGSAFSVLQGINWAIDNEMDIVSMSLGGEGNSSFLQDAFDFAYDNGILLIAASGNEGEEFVLYPAAYDSVIAVDSVNENLQRSGFSNYGPELELVASGEGVFLSDGNPHSGTSFSVPHVGVVAAALFSENEGIDNLEVRERLQETALDLGEEGRDDFFGFGLV